MKPDDDFFIPSFRNKNAIVRVFLLCMGLVLFFAVFEVAQKLDYGQELTLDFFLDRLFMHFVFISIMVTMLILVVEIIRPFLVNKNRTQAYLYLLLALLALVFVASLVSNWLYAQFGIEHWDWANVMLKSFFNALMGSMFLLFALHYFDIQHQLIQRREVELRTQLANLEKRITPNFFFNSMNTLLHLVETNSSDAPKMIESLSAYYRAVLKAPDLIAVADEVRLCNSYTEVENLRLEHPIHLSWSLTSDANFAQSKIPSGLLQNLLALAANRTDRIMDAQCVAVTGGFDGARLKFHVVISKARDCCDSGGKAINTTVVGADGMRRQFSGQLDDYAQQARLRLERYFGDEVDGFHDPSHDMHKLTLSYRV